MICAHLWDHHLREDTGALRDWVRRVDRLIPPGTELGSFTASRLFAAVYPEAVSWPACSPTQAGELLPTPSRSTNTGSWPRPAAASGEPPATTTAST